MMIQQRAPIGVFDSGVGGLTVVRRLMDRFPNEQIVYFGDTARVPYGTRSESTVRKYAAEDTRLLLQYRPKMIIVACGTVSALALETVRTEAKGIPVIGVLEPGAKAAVNASRNGKIGVIGTPGTIQSGAYERVLLSLNPEANVVSQACPLFVPLAEEGWFNHAATRLIVSEYLSPLLKQGIDTLILGCTHYPLLKEAIAQVSGPGVTIVNPSVATVEEVREILVHSVQESSGGGSTESPLILVSDLPKRFKSVAEVFLGMKIPEPTLISLG